MPINLDIDKDLLAEALEIAAGVRRRAATKFKPGSAAYTELANHATALENAAQWVKQLPTPLEQAIDKNKK